MGRMGSWWVGGGWCDWHVGAYMGMVLSGGRTCDR
jgi:hypothetical protein